MQVNSAKKCGGILGKSKSQNRKGGGRESRDKYFGKKARGEDIGNGRAEFTETGGSEE